MVQTRHRRTPSFQSSAVVRITKANFASKTAIAATSSICFHLLSNNYNPETPALCATKCSTYTETPVHVTLTRTNLEPPIKHGKGPITTTTIFFSHISHITFPFNKLSHSGAFLVS